MEAFLEVARHGTVKAAASELGRRLAHHAPDVGPRCEQLERSTERLDLVLVDGDPTRELTMLADPARGPQLVMKAGRVYRNRLQPA